MTLEDLRVFAAVCEASNLSAVARRLGRTQPAVSQHVTRLEREIGVPLLERRARGVVPTPAGRLLYQGCSAGLASIAAAVGEIERLRDGRAGTVSVSTGGTTVRHFMREAVVRFRRLHPDVALHFEPAGSTEACLEALRRHRADLAFVTIGPALRGFDQRPVLESPFRLLVHRDDPLASRRRLGARDLRGIRYIAISSRTSSHGILHGALDEAGVSLSPVVTVDDFDTANLFVELGLGHALVPAIHAHHFEGEGRVRALRIQGLPRVPVGWAARSFAALPKMALAFADLVAKTAQGWNDIDGLKLAPPPR